jgi:hypothetical protein
MEIPTRPSKFHRFSARQKWDLLLEYDKCLDRGAKRNFAAESRCTLARSVTGWLPGMRAAPAAGDSHRTR